MHTNEPELNPSFDINKVSFANVNKEFERRFRDIYNKSLHRISDSEDRLTHAGGATALEILKAMSRRMEDYDRTSDFETSYHDVQKELEPFTDT